MNLSHVFAEINLRSLEQNDCFHKWCRVIRDHINNNRKQRIADLRAEALATGSGDLMAELADWCALPTLTEETVKELVLLKLGNTKEILGEKVAMRSSKYKPTEAELTPAERKAGLISMSELLSAMDVWAAMDLNLKLVRDEE